MTDDDAQPDRELTFEEIRGEGERVRKHFQDTLDVALDYDRDTVVWLDGFIQRNRHLVTDEKHYLWAISLGYILGESLRRGFGGEWEHCDEFVDKWAVNMGDPVGIMNPIGKAYKYLRDDADSVLGFYDVIGDVKRAGGWNRIGTPAAPLWRRLWSRLRA